MITYDPRMRMIPPHHSYSGLARTEFQIVLMLRPHSQHAHLILSGTARECVEFLAELPPRLQNWY